MNQSIKKKSAALSELYRRIIPIVETMGGVAVQVAVPLSHWRANVAEPRIEEVPALRAKMPDGLRAEFAPIAPLSTLLPTLVRVRRARFGLPESDWSLTHLPDGWHWTQTPLSDDEIRKCLTPEGPPAIHN
jgi:hypothetical protein